MLRNERGIAIVYALAATVVGGVIIQTILMNIENNKVQQVAVQRALEATLFMRGIGDVLENAQACSNTLGYGYLSPTSAPLANNFNPNQLAGAAGPEPVQNVILRDPGSGAQIMFETWPGDPAAAAAPATAVPFKGAVLRSLYLQRRPGPAAELGSAVLTHQPELAGTALSEPYDVKAVRADLFAVIEDFSSGLSRGSRSLLRKIELIVYAMKPVASAAGWKIVTCSPSNGVVNLSGWAPGSTRVTVTGTNSVTCPPNTYAMSLLAVESSGNFNLTVDCANISR